MIPFPARRNKKRRGVGRVFQESVSFCFFSSRINFPRKHGGGVVHKKEEAKKSLLVHRGQMIALAVGGCQADFGQVITISAAWTW
jgi:hypothetical protein